MPRRRTSSMYDQLFGSMYDPWEKEPLVCNGNMLVMVYGSLKEGFGNHRLLIGQEFLGTFETADPEFFMISLGAFPGVHKGGSGRILGEVYRVDEDCFRSLDALEGNGYFYTREEVNAYCVMRPDGTVPGEMEVIQTWMYLLPRDDRQWGIAPQDKNDLESMTGVFEWMPHRVVGVHPEDGTPE